MQMLNHDAPGGRELVELDRAECLRLLATRAIGRVVFTVSALPTAQPVPYALDDEEVVFGAPRGDGLADAVRHHVVAFETDHVDEPTRTGWSVVGVGEAYEVLEPTRRAELVARLPPPWTPGPLHILSLPLQRLTGRRIRPRGATPWDVPRRRAS